MGTADAVPGVSGGTIALLLGIYERLIQAISMVTPSTLHRLITGFAPRTDRSWRMVLTEMDVSFLATLLAGILTAVILVTNTVDALSKSHPVSLFGFFLGLILASGVLLYREVPINTIGRVSTAVVGASIAFVVSGQTAIGLGTSPLAVFLTGMVAVSAMVLPGLSGALLLFLLGKYIYMAEQLTAFKDAVVSAVVGGEFALVIGPGRVVGLFLLGGLVGLLTISRLIQWALTAYRYATLAFLVGLVIGAVRAPIHHIDMSINTWTTPVFLTMALFAILGATLVFLVDHFALTVEL